MHEKVTIVSQAKPSQAKPSQAKPSQAKPSQAKPSQKCSALFFRCQFKNILLCLTKPLFLRKLDIS